jgi:xanthine dehydrogenase accessory factor
MNENEYLARTLNSQLQRNLPVVLVSLLNLKGSSPRHEGSKMIVTTDGKSHGTIGGSLLEASAISKAKKTLVEKQPELYRFEMTDTSTGAEGMMCGGTAEILLDYVAASSTNRQLAEYWLQAVSEGKDCFLITCFTGTDRSVWIGGRSLIFLDGKVVGDTPLDNEETGKIREALRTVTGAAVIESGDWNVLIDPMRKLKTLYLFGGGHVAVPTAHIAAMAGFRVVVVDDRPDTPMQSGFPMPGKSLSPGTSLMASKNSR